MAFKKYQAADPIARKASPRWYGARLTPQLGCLVHDPPRNAHFPGDVTHRLQRMLIWRKFSLYPPQRRRAEYPLVTHPRLSGTGR
jgi:hypothetical protein